MVKREKIHAATKGNEIGNSIDQHWKKQFIYRKISRTFTNSAKTVDGKIPLNMVTTGNIQQFKIRYEIITV